MGRILPVRLKLKDGRVIDNIKTIEFKPEFVVFSHPVIQKRDKKARVIGTERIENIKTIERQDLQ